MYGSLALYNRLLVYPCYYLKGNSDPTGQDLENTQNQLLLLLQITHLRKRDLKDETLRLKDPDMEVPWFVFSEENLLELRLEEIIFLRERSNGASSFLQDRAPRV